MLTTWGVVVDIDPADEGNVPGDPIAVARDAFARGRAAYFGRCSVLVGHLEAAGARLDVTDEVVDPIDPAVAMDGLRVAVSVIEVRPSSFEMAVRVRSASLPDEIAPPASGRCTVAITQLATGSRVPVPTAVRDEFIALQLAARDFA